jgi:hypothetical protein
MSYGKVHSSFWTDDKIMRLGDQAKLLALYLISGPHRNAIGCTRVPAQYICADTAWSAGTVAKALSELVAIGFITRDESTGWTLINNILKYDPIRGDKAAIGALRIAKTVPRDGTVYAALYARLQPVLERELKMYADMPEYTMEAPSMGDAKGHRSPEPILTLPEPTPAGASAFDSEFEPVWEIYPRKVGKGAARKAFRLARKKADLSSIVAGIKRIDRSVEEKFIPHMATWLNGERWLDSTAQSKPSAAPPPKSDREVWADLLARYKPGGFWPPNKGARPETGYCDAPADLLTDWTHKHGGIAMAHHGEAESQQEAM